MALIGTPTIGRPRHGKPHIGIPVIGSNAEVASGHALLAAPPAPTFTMLSGVSTYFPSFSFSDVLDGDTMRVQYATLSDFSDALAFTGVILSGSLNFEIDPLPDLTRYFRARIERLGYQVSDWSNTLDETIYALPSFINIGMPWRCILPFPSNSIRKSDLNVLVGLCGSI